MSEVVDKIRAILRRADESRNDSEAERETAMRKAQALMLEHGITMSDLGNLDDEDLPEGRKFGHDEAFVTARTESWRGSLLNRIAKAYFAKVWYSTRSHSRVWYLAGRADHVRATLMMFDWVEPQFQERFNNELEKMGLYQRLARKYALLVAGVPIHMLDRLLSDTTDEELAEIGARHFESIREHDGGEAALDDIQNRLGTSRNYAKHVRVHIRKRDIAPTVTRNLDYWRDTWFSFAISALGNRLDAMLREEAEKFGSKGTDLVVNERAALMKFIEDDLGMKLTNKPKKQKVDPHAAESGTKAGQEADIRPGHRISDDGAIALGSGE